MQTIQFTGTKRCQNHRRGPAPPLSPQCGISTRQKVLIFVLEFLKYLNKDWRTVDVLIQTSRDLIGPWDLYIGGSLLFLLRPTEDEWPAEKESSRLLKEPWTLKVSVSTAGVWVWFCFYSRKCVFSETCWCFSFTGTFRVFSLVLLTVKLKCLICHWSI